LVRAPELQNAEIQEYFSCKRIEVNSVTSKRTSDKILEILRQFETKLIDHFFKLGLSLVYIWLQNRSKNAKFDRKFLFEFSREKNSESTWSKLGNKSLGWSKTAVLRAELSWTAFPPKMLI
jgi:hypothetical protein